MSVNIGVTLYHAKWCKHCKNFMPEWDKFKNYIDTKHNTSKINYSQFEDGEMSRSTNHTINGNPIGGFPTLKITVTNNGKTKEFEYQGKRRASELQEFIKIIENREK